MPTNVVQRDAGHERFLAIVKGDAPLEHPADHRDHIVHLERDALVRMTNIFRRRFPFQEVFLRSIL